MSLVYYIYYSQQKIVQLYKQLAESRIVGQKSSESHSCHLHVDMHPPQHDKQQHGQQKHPLSKCLSHVNNSNSESCHKESHFDKNEMYQLERVLCALRKRGQLKKVRAGLKFCQGAYYEIAGCFAPEDTDAPEGYVWLRACEPEIRLLCHKMVFSGEHEHGAFEEIWACGLPLLLRGVALSLGCGDGLCGLPLVLWLK